MSSSGSWEEETTLVGLTFGGYILSKVNLNLYLLLEKYVMMINDDSIIIQVNWNLELVIFLNINRVFL